MFNHQGVKAAINTEDVRGELTLLQAEFQRSSDISSYSRYIDDAASRGDGGGDSTSMMARTREVEAKANARMATFTKEALTGILNLLEA